MGEVEELISDTLGCLDIVGLFSVMLYGCTCGQVMYYLTHYYVPGDQAYITVLVVLLWTLDTAKTIVDLICGWDIIVFKHGNAFSLLDKIPALLPGEFAASCSTIFIVQCCYLHTIWKFIKQSDRRKSWPSFMLPPFILSLGSFVTGLIATIQVQTAGNIFEALRKSEIAGSLRPACSAVVDVYITIWLCYHLQDAKTGHTQSDYMVTKLVNYAITRGIVTSIVQIIGFVLFLIDSQNGTLWFMLCYIPASTIYINSLLAMWNARNHVKTSGNTQGDQSGLSTSEVNVSIEQETGLC